MLEPVGHGSDGQFGDQPHQVRSDADVVRPLTDRFLPAGERRSQQRPRIDLAPLDDRAHAPRRAAGAAGGEVVTEPQQERQQPVYVEVDREIEDGGPLPSESFEQIGGRGARPADDAGRFRHQLHAARHEHPLHVDGGAEVGPLVDESQPASFRVVQGIVAGHAAPVSHARGRVGACSRGGGGALYLWHASGR